MPKWSWETAGVAWLIMLGAASGLSQTAGGDAPLLVPLLLGLFFGHLFYHGLRRTKSGRFRVVLWNRAGQPAEPAKIATGQRSRLFVRMLAAELLLVAFLALVLGLLGRLTGPGLLAAAEIFLPLVALFHRSLFYLVELVDDGVGRPAIALPRAVYFTALASLYYFMIIIGGRLLVPLA